MNSISLAGGEGGNKVNFIKSNIAKSNQCCLGSSHFIHSHMATEKSHVVGVNTSIISFQKKKILRGLLNSLKYIHTVKILCSHNKKGEISFIYFCG